MDQSEALTPFLWHKTGDELRINHLPALEPYSVNRGGFINQQLPRISNQLAVQNLVHKSPSDLEDFDYAKIQVPTWVADQLTVSTGLVNKIRKFLKRVDPRKFFEKHDKTRIYPRVTDESRYIAMNDDLRHHLRTNTGPVDDPRLFERLRNRKREVWETHCDRSLKPVIRPTYVISKEFKNLYISDAVDSLSKSTGPEYIERKLNIRPLYEQCSQEIDGELVWLNGMIVVNEMTVEDAMDDAWQFAEYPGGKPIRVEFDGEIDIPEHQLYNCSLGVLGPVKIRSGKPVVKAVALIKNGDLPESLRTVQTQALSRLSAGLEQRIFEKQQDIENTLRVILQEGQISKDDQWLLFDILDRIQDAETLYEILETITNHEQSERVFELIADHIEHIQI